MFTGVSTFLNMGDRSSGRRPRGVEPGDGVPLPNVELYERVVPLLIKFFIFLADGNGAFWSILHIVYDLRKI